MSKRANEHVHPAVSETAFGGAFTATSKNGLTLREHFAGLAMQGILAARQFGVTSEVEARWVAHHAAIHADALLAELERTP